MMSNPSLQVEIDNCVFEGQYGINTMSGGAVFINGKQGDNYEIMGRSQVSNVSQGQVVIKNSLID